MAEAARIDVSDLSSEFSEASRSGRFLEDFQVGQVVRGGPRVIGERDLLFCTLWCGDGQPHSNEVYSRGTPFGQRIVHGDAMFAVGAGLVHAQVFAGTLEGIEALALRFPKPIRVGDAIGARLTITAIEPNAGIVEALLEVLNETLGTVAIEGRLRYAVRRRP